MENENCYDCRHFDRQHTYCNKFSTPVNRLDPCGEFIKRSMFDRQKVKEEKKPW